MVKKCKKSRQDSRAAPSRCAVLPLNKTAPHGCLVVLLKAIELSASVMHSIECPASSYSYSSSSYYFFFNFFTLGSKDPEG